MIFETLQCIKEGYRVVFVSWENDGDDYKTLFVDGLTEYSARMMVDIAWLFHQNNDEKNYSNLSHDEYEQIQEDLHYDIEQILFKYKDHVYHIDADLQSIKNALDPKNPLNPSYVIEGIISTYLNKIFGGGGEYFKTRVVEKIAVLDVPQTVQFEDVTSNFLPVKE